MTNKEKAILQNKIDSLRKSNEFWAAYISTNEATIAEAEVRLAQEEAQTD